MIKFAEPITSRTIQQNIRKAIEDVLSHMDCITAPTKTRMHQKFRQRFPNASKVFTPESLRQALTDIVEHLASKEIYQTNDYHALALYDAINMEISRHRSIEDILWDTDFLDPPGTYTKVGLYEQYRRGITEDTMAIDLLIPYKHEKMRLQPEGHPLTGIMEELDKYIAITIFTNDETPLKTISYANFYNWLYNVGSKESPMPAETWGKKVPIAILTRRENNRHRIEFTFAVVKEDGTVDGPNIARLGMLKHNIRVGIILQQPSKGQEYTIDHVLWHPTKTKALIAAYTALPGISINHQLTAAAQKSLDDKAEQQQAATSDITEEEMAITLHILQEENTPESLYLAAQAYREGIGIGKDMTKAIKLYRLAAEKGHMYAMHNLAVAYTIGDGVPKNPQTALKYRKRAAERGSLADMSDLASQYLNGEHVPHNKKEGIRLYREASDKGYPQALFNLALMYATGEAVPEDTKKAFDLYSQAAQKGYPNAITNLAQCYFAGTGVEPDIDKAIELYKKASAMGDHVADFALGLIYIMPNIFRYNAEKAYEHLVQAHITKAKEETLHYLESTKETMDTDTCVRAHLKAAQAVSIKSNRLAEFINRSFAPYLDKGIEMNYRKVSPAEKHGIVIYYDPVTQQGRLQDVTDGSIWDIDTKRHRAETTALPMSNTIVTYDTVTDPGNNKTYAKIKTAAQKPATPQN